MLHKLNIQFDSEIHTEQHVLFFLGDNIFGRVMVDNNDNTYRVKIEKVLLCAGQDGYIPTFKPSNNEFGCLVDTDRLKYRLQVLVSVSCSPLFMCIT